MKISMTLPLRPPFFRRAVGVAKHLGQGIHDWLGVIKVHEPSKMFQGFFSCDGLRTISKNLVLAMVN